MTLKSVVWLFDGDCPVISEKDTNKEMISNMWNDKYKNAIICTGLILRKVIKCLNIEISLSAAFFIWKKYSSRWKINKCNYLIKPSDAYG